MTTDTLETVQHFDQRTTLADALLRHMDAEKAAGITGQRTYHMRANGAGTDWIIAGEPADDFPCCTNRECHACGGTGSIKQQVYLGMKEPHHYSVCTQCGGTGKDA